MSARNFTTLEALSLNSRNSFCSNTSPACRRSTGDETLSPLCGIHLPQPNSRTHDLQTESEGSLCNCRGTYLACGAWTLCCLLVSHDLICLACVQAGWNDVPVPVMALVLDGMPAKDIWPLRAVGSRWAHAVRSVTAFELSVQADRHKLRANLSAIYRHHQRNYPLAHFVLRLSEIMSFCQAARLLLMVTKLVSVSSTAGVQHRLDPSKM